MKRSTIRSSRRTGLVLLFVLLALLAVGGMVFLSQVAGHSLGPRESASMAVDLLKAVAGRGAVLRSAAGEQPSVVFLHHSVGNNLIEQSTARDLLTQAGVEFWDQGHNSQGLRDPAGQFTGYAYPMPGDNTDVDGLAVMFAQREYHLPLNTLSGLLQHDVIIVKSCFPNNNIGSDQKLEEYQAMYQGMLPAVDRHPEKLFIFVTSPPLNPAETTLENAARARQMANWLISPEFTAGRSNLAVVDLFSLLAVTDPASPEANMLRADYRQGSDSHPTAQANRIVAPLWVDAILQAIDGFRRSF